jgi:TonB family protein
MRRLRSPLAFLCIVAAQAIPSPAQQQPISAQGPIYPLAARAAGIEGDVTIKAVLATDGTVHDLRAIAGPKELQQAAIDAVGLWRYHPYLQHGKPSQTDLTVTVRFRFGNKKQKAEAMAKAQAELAAHSDSATPGPQINPPVPPATN